MPLMKIAPKPGMFTDGTRYSAEGTWYDADKVRFRKGFVEKIGGWSKYITDRFLGVCRSLHDWVTVRHHLKTVRKPWRCLLRCNTCP